MREMCKASRKGGSKSVKSSAVNSSLRSVSVPWRIGPTQALGGGVSACGFGCGRRRCFGQPDRAVCFGRGTRGRIGDTMAPKKTQRLMCSHALRDAAQREPLVRQQGLAGSGRAWKVVSVAADLRSFTGPVEARRGRPEACFGRRRLKAGPPCDGWASNPS